MRILMLGNSFTFANHMPQMLSELTGAEVVHHTRGGAALQEKGWDYQQMAQGLWEAYRKAARDNHALIAEVGRRFYDLSDTQALYAADGAHPSQAGSRIAAQTIAAVIQGHRKKPHNREAPRASGEKEA